MFDLNLVEKHYNSLSKKISCARQALNRPLSFAEKILYTHTFDSNIHEFKRGEDYVNFSPDRVAMQDATAQMALLQFMLTGKKEVAVPTTVHCDHLITAKKGASKDLDTALTTNTEVYNFLESVSSKYGIGFWKPGAGIIHQIVLENYAFPGGLLIGTDSHTVNAGGLGMVAVGVGGADAVDVISGMPWELKMPKLIGVKLTGKLNGWTSAKDIILHIAGILTTKGGTGYILEYFGEGAESLSCTGKGTICNMGAEIGATNSVFGYDNKMEEYLIGTDRKEVANLANQNRENLKADPEVYQTPEKYFDQLIEIDLNKLEPHLNGPFTPDKAWTISEFSQAAKENNYPTELSAGLIGSCTNSSYEDLSRSASIVKFAKENKIKLKSEFYVTPGSEQIRKTIERDGILNTFTDYGAYVLANACGPCIGQWDRKGAENKPLNSIVTSYNRNFAKRADGNPNTHAFVASPELVTALSIAGRLDFNPITDSIKTEDGKNIKLPEPKGHELPKKGFLSDENGLIKPNSKNKDVEVVIKRESDRLQALEPFSVFNIKNYKNLNLLIKVEGKCTTDHISMAGSWLKYRGHLDNISNNLLIGATNFFNKKVNTVLNPLTGEYTEVPKLARAYKSNQISSVIITDENYGEGSSREHAAMEPRHLNVKVVIAKSYARIHETNLKKQGVLALSFKNKQDYELIKESDKFELTGVDTISPNSEIIVNLKHTDGTEDSFTAVHTYSTTQIEWLKAGSAINLIRKEN